MSWKEFYPQPNHRIAKTLDKLVDGSVSRIIFEGV